jgi:hypothetical protein
MPTQRMPTHRPQEAVFDAFSQHPALKALILPQSPTAVCEAAIDLWERLSNVLVAIIGTEGFEALYSRSVHLAAADFSWLKPDADWDSSDTRFYEIRSAMRDRPMEEAGQAMVVLFSTFTGVLSTLIGLELTTNILRAAWGDAYEETAQEQPNV